MRKLLAILTLALLTGMATAEPEPRYATEDDLTELAEGLYGLIEKSQHITLGTTKKEFLGLARALGELTGCVEALERQAAS